MNDPVWMPHAWHAFGQQELAGVSANTHILALFRDAGHPTITSDEVAWCAAFVGASLERAGVRSTRSLMARSYTTWGDALAEPRHGAIAVLSRGSDPSLGHVGFWLGDAGDDLIILGGNQQNAVSVKAFPKARLLSLRWPPPPEPTNAPAPDHTTAADALLASDKLFAAALAHVLDMEGGYTDDPHDPGGPTNFGITLAEYASWVGTRLDAGNRDRLVRDLKRIGVDTVREIYRRRYWIRASCSRLPAALAIMHFDAAVNHGVGAAARMLQEAVGATIDGEIGPQTMAAAASSDPARSLARYADLRRSRYRRLPTFWRFGRGWLARVDSTLDRGRQYLSATQNLSPDDPTRNTEPPAKGARPMSNDRAASHSADLDTAESQSSASGTTHNEPAEGKWWGASLTIWGTVITTLSTVVPIVGGLVGVDITSGLVQQMGQDVTGVAQALAALAGTVLTIYGRVRAAKPLERRNIQIRL